MQKQNALWLDPNNIDQNIIQIRVGDTMVIPTDSVTNLGVIVDENLFMEKHIATVSRAVCVSITNIGMNNQPVAELLTHALIISSLDSCNSLLHGLNKTQLKRLQRLQNTAARLVTLSRKCTHITPILKQLHYQSNRESSSKYPCLCSRRSSMSRLLTCADLLNRTKHSVEIRALQTSCY